jgi:hypothetical protein
VSSSSPVRVEGGSRWLDVDGRRTAVALGRALREIVEASDEEADAGEWLLAATAATVFRHLDLRRAPAVVRSAGGHRGRVVLHEATPERAARIEVAEDLLAPDERLRLVDGLAHAGRHAFQSEVMDRLRPDRRVAAWRIAWGDHGGFAGACPPAGTPLEDDATVFAEVVVAAYLDERERQLTLRTGIGALADFAAISRA